MALCLGAVSRLSVIEFPLYALLVCVDLLFVCLVSISGGLVTAYFALVIVLCLALQCSVFP